jgi:uncharacterized protein YeaO (DUF488 family)
MIVLLMKTGMRQTSPRGGCKDIESGGRHRGKQTGLRYHLSTRAEQMMTRIHPANVKLKRAYEPPGRSDGKRILIDRLWPRGVRKEDAKIDEWMKEIAPSSGLRKWFGHDPARWSEFQHRYHTEIEHHPEQLERLRMLAREGPITLVFSAHDEAHNDAVVLRELILGYHSRGPS